MNVCAIELRRPETVWWNTRPGLTLNRTSLDWRAAMQSTQDLALKLLANSERDEGSGCLRWTGSHNHKGYGYIGAWGKTRSVHRVAYELWIGPIPVGLEIDHVRSRGCTHRDCFEPSHLEAVTHAENIHRSRPKQHLVGYCPQGHKYDEENTSVRDRGSYLDRSCKRCRQDRLREQVDCDVCGLTVTKRNIARHRTLMHPYREENPS